MNRLLSFFLLVALAAVSSVEGFATSGSVPVMGGAVGGSNFVVSQHRSAAPITRENNMRKGDMRMGKMAKFGVFSPAVYASKIVLGEAQLNKIRGKAISLHSQYIGDFCTWAGAYHLRTRLIKKAKTNGDILGFLV